MIINCFTKTIDQSQRSRRIRIFFADEGAAAQF